jgi:hypothetical protein
MRVGILTLRSYRSRSALAKWTYEESDRDGIRKVRWRSPEERSGAARRSGVPLPASDLEAA